MTAFTIRMTKHKLNMFWYKL